MSNEYLAIQQQYEMAMNRWLDSSIEHAGAWFKPDVDEFNRLYTKVQTLAESGDAWAQYAAATILHLGLRCSTQQEYAESYTLVLPTMSRLLASAARQGHLEALDNLVTSGIGFEAERARLAAKTIQQDMPELIGSSLGMPSYGPNYFDVLYKKLYE